MKTVKEWLMELPDGYRERALVNLQPHKADEIVDSMHTAIRKLKYWTDTKEGYTWWQCVEEHYRKEKHMKYWQPALPLLPEPTGRELIEAKIAEVMTENNMTDEDLGKTMYENGIIDGLKWVLENIDLDDE